MRTNRYQSIGNEHIVLFILCCITIYYVGHQHRKEWLPKWKASISENSIFIYRAYIDQRGSTPRLRVLAFNGCHNDSALSARIEDEWTPLKPTPMYNTCPEIWAYGCALVAYYHDVELNHNFSGTDVAIRGLSETKIVPVHVAEPAKKLGFTICVAPMFWYTDWSKLIFFIEWWKAQKAEEILVYVHSTSAEVREVLNYYEKKDWITIVSWPMLPQSENFQPNDEVYRLGQILAHNDCILRTKTELASAVDIDEILYTMKEPLIDYAIKNFEDQRIGALIFNHRAAIFESPLIAEPFIFEAVDYKGVRKMYHKKFDRNPKLIVRTDAVERMAVHAVPAFRNNEKSITAKDAVLLHIRYDTDVQSFQNDLSHEVAQIVTDPVWFQLNLQSKTQAIFPNGASFHPTTQNILGNCTDSWKETQGRCKAPVTYCRKAVEKMEIWVEETENVFTVV